LIARLSEIDPTDPDREVNAIEYIWDENAALAVYVVQGSTYTISSATGEDWASKTIAASDSTVTKGACEFKIDHPLDPENKYLYHTSMESSEMLNCYSGNVTVGRGGTARVVLPEWFEAINKDCRYQLTSIGSPASGLYVSKEISDGSFEIAGGSEGLKVSWQVTAVRDDAYAKAHRTHTEVEKPANEKGKYLYPLEHGKPLSMGVRPVQAESPRTAEFPQLDLGKQIRATRDALDGASRSGRR
jgi:hypothetical protein